MNKMSTFFLIAAVALLSSTGKACAMNIDETNNIHTPRVVELNQCTKLEEALPTNKLDKNNTESLIIDTSAVNPIKNQNAATNRENSGFVKTVVELVLKEPIRLVQFAIKTSRLKQAGHVIPKTFTFCTTLRFFGATISEGCTIANTVNIFLDTPFLKDKASLIWLGSFATGEALKYVGRSIVKSMYGDVSALYGNANFPSNTVTPSKVIK